MSEEITKDSCKRAKSLRLKYVPLRTGGDKAGVAYKSDVLKLSKAIDSIRKKIKETATEKETKLKERETHFERIEAEKKEALKAERLADLEKYDIDGSAFGVENMTQDVWDSFLIGQKTTYEKEKSQKRQELLDRLNADKIKELNKERTDILKPYWDFLTADDLCLDFGKIEASEFNQVLNSARSKKVAEDQKQAEIKQENDRLKQEADRLEQERLESERIAKEQAPDKEKLISWLNSFDLTIPTFSNEKFSAIAKQFVAHVKSSIEDTEGKL